MFNHLEMEKKWQKYWDEHNTFYTDTRDFSKPKFYALDMFPYPSGVGFILLIPMILLFYSLIGKHLRKKQEG